MTAFKVTYLKGWPPNIEELRRAFPKIRKGVIFTYGTTVYYTGAPLNDALKEHESVHVIQQMTYPGDGGPYITEPGPGGWWDRYINDRNFRYEQELEAHAAEYRWYMENGGRQQRRAAFRGIVKRLSGSLYNCGRKSAEVAADIKNMAAQQRRQPG